LRFTHLIGKYTRNVMWRLAAASGDFSGSPWRREELVVGGATYPGIGRRAHAGHNSRLG
jgi:hypothetical protein